MKNMITRRSLAKNLIAATVAAGLPSALTAAGSAHRYPAFIMDVHIHFGVDGEGSKLIMADPEHFADRKQQSADLYGPWDQVYDAQGDRQPRVSDFGTVADSDKLVAYLDGAGVDVAVIFPFESNRVAKTRREVRFDATNEAIAGAVRKHPQRLIGLCGHDPFRAQWQGPLELKRRVEQDGFKGMKLYPPYYKFDPSDRDLDPLYRTASDVGAVLTFHTGWAPLARAPMKYGHPDLLDDVAMRFPDLKINMAHAGGVSWWEEAVLVAARHRNMTMDISSWCGYSPRLLVQLLDLARDLVGLDRMLYGSEHTLCPPPEFIGLLLNINEFAEKAKVRPFDKVDIEKMLGLNAARLYGVEPTKRT
jgi:predicted TIM-barrel fold metal-dependent hydrolase